MNETCLATIFIMSVGLNVIWRTYDVFYVFKWSSYDPTFLSANTIYACLIVECDVCMLGSYMNDA